VRARATRRTKAPSSARISTAEISDDRSRRRHLHTQAAPARTSRHWSRRAPARVTGATRRAGAWGSPSIPSPASSTGLRRAPTTPAWGASSDRNRSRRYLARGRARQAARGRDAVLDAAHVPDAAARGRHGREAVAARLGHKDTQMTLNTYAGTVAVSGGGDRAPGSGVVAVTHPEIRSLAPHLAPRGECAISGYKESSNSSSHLSLATQ
jgi:hypothetical protein